MAICFDDLLGQFIIASIERFFRDPLVLRYPGGWVGLEVETMGQIAMHLVVHSLVFLLPQHDPGLELTSPPSHDGIVQNLATLGVVERYAVVVADQADVVFNEEILEGPVEKADGLAGTFE